MWPGFEVQIRNCSLLGKTNEMDRHWKRLMESMQAWQQRLRYPRSAVLAVAQRWPGELLPLLPLREQVEVKVPDRWLARSLAEASVVFLPVRMMLVLLGLMSQKQEVDDYSQRSGRGMLVADLTIRADLHIRSTRLSIDPQ